MKTLKERLSKNVVINKDTGCHEWMGAKAGVGYGYFTIYKRGEKNKNIYIHRAIYEFNHGKIPKGMRVLHRCDNPCCCNINHLFMGTCSENTKDMIKKGRHPAHMKKGWQRTKITQRQYNEIIDENNSILGLRKKYGYSRDFIRMIRLTKDESRISCQD